MNTNPKIRRRISFTPIMLTSKSIRPVDRSDYQLTRNQRRFSGVKKTRDDLTSYLRGSSEFANTTTAFERQDYDPSNDPFSEEPDEQHFKEMVRKMTTPTVVKVEFQNELMKQRRKAQLKIRQNECEGGEGRSENNRFIYFTNAKTFEQFTKMSKIRPSRKLAQQLRDQADQQWKKYLDKYYLNIRKVKPLLKKDAAIQLLSPQKISRLVERSPEIQDPPPEQLTRFKSNTQIRAHSRRQSNKKDRRMDSPSQRSGSQDPTDEIRNNSIYKKIEQDINNHKSGGHRKDFFVFGLSESAGTSSEAIVKAKFDIYKDFLFRINFTNGLYVKYREQTEKPLKFFVGFGNNSAIVKGMMRRRFWWQITQKMNDEVNFSWTQLKISDFFKGQTRNPCKFKLQKQRSYSQRQRGESYSLAMQKSSQNEDSNKNIMCGQDLRIWDRYMDKHSKQEDKGFESGLTKRVNGLLKKKDITFIDNSTKIKMHNHLQCNYFLGNKKALFYSLRKYYQLQNIDPFTKIPLTFHITQGIQDPQFDKFLEQFDRQRQNKNIDKDFRNIWIVKPGQLTNRGRGITVCSTLDEIKIRLKAKQKNSNGTARTFIVQKYIEKPLLYQRRKFDIRHYMMITCHAGKMKGYWYAEGYIRTTSSEYNIKNTKDLMTHLTNDAVQKNGQDYGKYEKGNKVSYADFQKYLINHVNPDVDFFKHILPKMKEMATESIRATYSMLDPQRREHNFQLFGLDFMLDDALNVYIIEVNTNPCLQTSCPLLTKIITPLMENVFKIGLDPIFPPPFEWSNQKKFALGDNALEQNKFTLVFDECQQGQQLNELYRNTPHIDQKMGDIFEEQQEYQDEQKEWNDQQQAAKK